MKMLLLVLATLFEKTLGSNFIVFLEALYCGGGINIVEEECPSTSAANGFDGGEKVKQGGTKGSRLTRRASTDLKCKFVHKRHSNETDNLALMMELLGMMPRKIALGGHYSRDLFNRHGDLRHIRKKRDQKPETQI
ncbi:hypothetical protein YC2023_024790 [Brassica napus]